jgi:hypothetical protein
MRWVVTYQKGSFCLQEGFDVRDEATQRVLALTQDSSVWSVTVKDVISGSARVVPLHARQCVKDLELE